MTDKELLELERIRGKIRQQLDQEHHWDQQQKHWKWLTLIGVLAVIANALKPLWS